MLRQDLLRLAPADLPPVEVEAVARWACCKRTWQILTLFKSQKIMVVAEVVGVGARASGLIYLHLHSEHDTPFYTPLYPRSTGMRALKSARGRGRVRVLCLLDYYYYRLRTRNT